MTAVKYFPFYHGPNSLSPITPWETDGETVETAADFIFLGSKITAVVTAAMKLKDPYSLEGKLRPT